MYFNQAEFGRRAAELRSIKRMTQEDLAEKLGVSKKHISEIERGIALGILAVPDDTSVTDMDIDTIVRLDAIDGFQFCTAAISISQLIVRSTIQYRTS